MFVMILCYITSFLLVQNTESKRKLETIFIGQLSGNAPVYVVDVI